ncbi:MAG: hypothetical protein AB7E72_16885 [Lysobacterales bacterium]
MSYLKLFGLLGTLFLGASAAKAAEFEKYFGIGHGCNRPVNVVASDAGGRIYLVGTSAAEGRVTHCGDAEVAHGVAVYNPVTERFSSLANLDQVDVDGVILSVATAGSDLYISGTFTHIGTVAADRLARWDGVQWHPLGAGAAGVFGGDAPAIAAIEATPDGLYVGGRFTQVGPVPASNLAFWNRASDTWSALGAGLDGVVTALEFAVDSLYVGGAFTQAGGIGALRVARWNGTQWSALGGGLTVGDSVGEPVVAIASSGTDVYVIGNLAVAADTSLRYLARWDGSLWQAVGDPALAVVAGGALAVSGQDVFVSGVLGRNISRFDGTGWTTVGNIEPTSTVTSLLAVAPKLYAGGSFYAIGNVLVDNVARWDATSWLPLAIGAPRVSNGVITAMSVGVSGVYIGGKFTEVDGVPALSIARWNGTRWAPLGGGITVGSEATSGIFEIREIDGRVYVGGSFLLAGGVAVNNIAVWDGTSWAPLGSGVDGRVLTIEAFQGSVYVGGDFGRAGAEFARAIARWDGASWSAVGGAAAGSGSVFDLTVFQSELYAANDVFSTIIPRGVGRWDGASWAVVGTPLANATPRTATRLLPNGSELLVVGTDTAIPTQRSIYRWDGSAWTILATVPLADIAGAIDQIALSDGRIFLYGRTVSGRDVFGYTAFRDFDGVWKPFYIPASFRIEQAQPILFASDGDALSVLGFDLRASGQALRLSRPLAATPPEPAVELTARQVRISRDGRAAVFTGRPAADSTGPERIYHRLGEQLHELSAEVGALEPGATSYSDPVISGDGSRAAMVASSGQIYAVRVNLGEPQLLSRSAAGIAGNGPSAAPMIGLDGTRVVFESRASNLVANDGNGSVSDIFAKNLGNEDIELISVASDGTPANGPSTLPWASDDGQRVVYATAASNLVDGLVPSHTQIVLADRSGSHCRNLLVSRNLATGAPGNGPSSEPRLTPNGRYGVFSSAASNLVAGDSNGATDVFMFEYDGTAIVRLERLSVGAYGHQSDGSSSHPSISDDGSFVAFDSTAGNLTLYDRNALTDVFIKDVATSELLRQSATVNGTAPDGASSGAEISGDATAIAFVSDARQLVAGDNNDQRDAFIAPMRIYAAGGATPAPYQPGLETFALPAPNPPYANCPAGYFIAALDDGPAVGLSPGLFGLEVLLNLPGTQRLEGGLNFGGLIDAGQPGFAGFNFNNPASEAQRLDLNLSGYPATSISGSMPVRIQVIHQTSATASEVVFDRTTSLSMATPFIDSIVITPGFYVATVVPIELPASALGGPADGQIFVQLGTRFVDRVGGGFSGGVVVGGYHAPHPFDDVSGFAAFCIATPHSVRLRTYTATEYGSDGARDLRLRLFDYQRNVILNLP